MRLASPPTWLRNWRTDPATAIISSLLICAAIVAVNQSRSADLIRRLQADAAREQGDLARRFDQIQAELNRLSKNSPHSPNDPNPKLAANSGRKAIEEGRWGAGQIYLINAITNDPTNVEHLKTYTRAVLSHQSPPAEALDQLSSILQTAACHVPTEDVSTVLAQIERVEQKRVALQKQGGASTTGDEPAPTGDNLDAEWARLRAAPTDVHRDPARLATHLRALENFAATLEEQDHPDEARTRAVADEVRRWTETAQAARNVAYVDQCLARLADAELPRTDNDRAVAIVQAAEAVLPSFWGIHPGSLPDDLQQAIDNYPARIKGRVDAIGLKKSAGLIKQIEEKLLAKVDVDKLPKSQGKTLGPIEKRCLAIEEQIKEAQVLAAQLPSPDQILTAQAKIEPRSQALQKARGEQYSAFQAAVISRCKGAFQDYQTYRTGLSESDAVKVFNDNLLQEVDQALLNPEVSRLFNDILGKLMAEMGAPKLVEIEGKMSSAEKLKVERF